MAGEHLFLAEGELITVEGNKPFILNEKESVWIVVTGSLELYSVKLSKKEKKPIGKRMHMFSIPAGGVVFGLDMENENIGIIARGAIGSSLLKIKKELLIRAAHDKYYHQEAVRLVNSWAGVLTLYLSEKKEIKGKCLQPNQKYSTVKGENLTALKGAVIWVEQIKGLSKYCDKKEYILRTDNILTPVTDKSYITVLESGEIGVTDTESLVKNTDFFYHLEEFEKFVLKHLITKRRTAIVEEKRSLEKRLDFENRKLNKAINNLYLATTGKYNSEKSSEEYSNVYKVCMEIAKITGIKMPDSMAAKRTPMSDDPVKDIAKASRMRARRIILRGRWWEEDNGPLVGYRDNKKEIIAIIPKSPGKYMVYDPKRAELEELGSETAAEIEPIAYTVYKPMPDTIKNIFELAKFGLTGNWYSDFVTIFIMGLLGGIIAMIIPISTGMIFDSVIPQGDKSQLLIITIMLVMNSAVIMLFQVAKSVATLRVETRMNYSIQSAVWDKLLSLPVTFFKNYSTGDMSLRANGINAIRSTLSGATVTTIITSTFSFFNLFILFYFDAGFALIALGLVAVSLVVTITAAMIKLKIFRKITTSEGNMTGLILQIINGISKIRVAGAEKKAYFQWAEAFAQKRAITYKVGGIENIIKLFNAVYPVITSMVIFSILTLFKLKEMSTGSFLAFNTAFTVFLTEMLSLTNVIIGVIQVIPIYERAKPILETKPEEEEHKEEITELKGEIEFTKISFRYGEDMPYVLKDISFAVKPGEFLAIVGSSGSGKSTIMRLLLGFEKPVSGKIFYDGEDIDIVDIRSLRKNLGVVLQNDKLISGDILSNIVGSRSLTKDDAEEAVRLVGLSEEIEAMPMKMNTVIGEGAKTFSGGQRQRIFIARAIVHKPRVLLLDEATSALDNKAQAIVAKSLDNLKVTRIVIAHRLSTIVNADRIIVLEKGKIVEQGNYRELMGKKGFFYELAKRQLT